MPQQSALTALLAAVSGAVERRDLTADPAWAHLTTLPETWPEGATITIDDNLDAIAAVFELTPQARDLLLTAAAADIDPTFAWAYGALLGADGPRPASIALALELAGIPPIGPDAWAELGEHAPLRRWQLIEIGNGDWTLGRSLTATGPVIAALTGATTSDPVAAAMTVAPWGLTDLPQATGAAELTAALTAGHRLCWVENPPGGAGVAAAWRAFTDADISCRIVDFARRPSATVPVDALRHAIRDAALHRSGLIVTSAELLVHHEPGTAADAAAIAVAAASPVPIMLVGASRWNAQWHPVIPITARSAPLTSAERLSVWRRYIEAGQVPDTALVPYRLTPRQIVTVARYATDQARIGAAPVSAASIAQGVRLLGGSAGISGARGAAPTTFADLQLPDDTRGELDRLASWVRLRDTMTPSAALHGLGGKGTGVAALFTGNPGTGKTLAAHVIADTAGLELMQIDLSGVVDKYIGETEKHLERIFTDAENLNVVLFFDEADSLFGKRSDVRDSHDRFANQEVAYLLQRMEQFDGITILATNLKGNLDVAFSRRLHFVIHFPDPDEATRARLWAAMLDRAGPTSADDPVTIESLAAELELSGGDIRNIVMSAAYDAAAQGVPIGMRQVTAAAIREYGKLGRRIPARIAGAAV